jgi:hypothetical protein
MAFHLPVIVELVMAFLQPWSNDGGSNIRRKPASGIIVHGQQFFTSMPFHLF